MFRYLCSLLLLTVLFSCTEELLLALHPNAIGTGAPPFELVRTDIVQRSETRGDATLYFTSVYSRLNADQQARITGIEVVGYSGFIGRFELDVEASSFTLTNLRTGQRHCASLHFISEEQDSPEVEFCVTL